MKQLLLLLCLISLPAFLLAQKKYQFKKQRAFSVEQQDWSRPEKVKTLVVFDFKNGQINLSGNKSLNYKVADARQDIDAQTQAPCLIVDSLCPAGKKVQIILYEDSKDGLRIIHENGNIDHFFK